MVTPNVTPQRSPEQRLLPAPNDSAVSFAGATSVRRPGPLETTAVSAGDVSFNLMNTTASSSAAAPATAAGALANGPAGNVSWADTSAVSAAAAYQMPQNRNVLPLPTMLERARSQGVTNMSNGMVSIDLSATAPAGAGASATLNHTQQAGNSFHHQSQTFSTSAKMRRASPTRGRVRPGSGGAKRALHTSSASNFSGIHVPDASCCGYRRAEEHATRPTSGLFVTFCEHDLTQRVDTAMKDLESERDARMSDAHLHKVEMVKMLRRTNAAESERDTYKAKFEALVAEHEQSVKDSRVIRDEFERRWRESLADREKEAAELNDLRAFKQRMDMSNEARGVELDNASKRIDELKASLALSDKDAGDHSRRAQQYFEELSIARKTVEALTKENGRLQETLQAREQIIRGMEKELGSANEKLSSIHVLRSSLRGGGGGASAASKGASSLGKPTS